MLDPIRSVGAALLVAMLAGCAQPGPQGTGSGAGAGATRAGRPADAARAVGQLEYLATEMPSGPRWREFDPTVGPALQQARQEERAILGIAPQAPPQAVIDALYGTARALQAGDTVAAQRI